MFSSLRVAKSILHLLGQLGENIIIGRRIVVRMFFLVHQRNINQRHQRYRMVALTPLIGLGVGGLAFGDEFCCQAIVFLVVPVDDNLYLFVIDVQPDM